MTPKVLDSLQWRASDKYPDQLPNIIEDLLSALAGDKRRQDVTATADGLTTGLIAATTGVAFVTSGNANHIVTLPAPTEELLGKTIRIVVGATGCELRSDTPASVGINGGVGAAAESAIAAGVTVHATLSTLTNWTAFQQTAAGVLTLTEVAA